MPLYFECPHCSMKQEVEENFFGREVFCQNCGRKVMIARPMAAVTPTTSPQAGGGGVSNKSLLAYVLLGVFLGCYGIHDFYAGYTTNGVAKLLITLLTCGLGSIVTMIWAIVDICTVRKDASGRPFAP